MIMGRKHKKNVEELQARHKNEFKELNKKLQIHNKCLELLILIDRISGTYIILGRMSSPLLKI